MPDAMLRTFKSLDAVETDVPVTCPQIALTRAFDDGSM